MGNILVLLYWGYSWMFVPGGNSSRPAWFDQRCFTGSSRTLPLVCGHNYQPHPADQRPGATRALSSYAACFQAALAHVSRDMGTHDVWPVLRPHHGLPDDERWTPELAALLPQTFQGSADQTN